MKDSKNREMDIHRCLEILDLGNGNVSEDELRRAYKDALHVWHPDRFSHNPRLRAKAEEKTKEINAAYEILSSHLTSGKGPEAEKGKDRNRRNGKDKEAQTRDMVESAAEIGTLVILNVWSYLSGIVGRLADNSESSRRKEERDSENG